MGDQTTAAPADPVSDLVVPRRFRGPASSANGGWSSGALASLLDPEHGAAVTVTLRRPPPLETPMAVARTDVGLVAAHDGEPVLEATVAASEPQRVAAVSLAEARKAQDAYPGLPDHPFPMCFTCGVDREPGDGLRIFPGPLAPGDSSRNAGVWVPHESLHEDWHEYAGAERRASLAATWAALDCPGAWTIDMAGRKVVLGRMTARVASLPVVGEEHVVVGLNRATEGRKHHTSATIYDSTGNLVGTAEHIWFTIDPEAFA